MAEQTPQKLRDEALELLAHALAKLDQAELSHAAVDVQRAIDRLTSPLNRI